MKIFSDGQFSIGAETYVFVPEHGKQLDRFIPVRKTKGKILSDVNLNYVSIPTLEPSIRNFYMGLFNRKFEPFMSNSKPIECKGTIHKEDSYYNNTYRQQVRDMLEQAAKILEIEEANKIKESFGDAIHI